MKLIFLFLLLTISSFAQEVELELEPIEQEACLNFIPESEAKRIIAASPNPIAGSGITCTDLPDEACLCFDGIEWEAAEIVEGKLVNDEKKLKIKEDTLKKEKLEAEAKLKKKEAALKALESVDFEKITTIKTLKEVVQLILEAK
jgi:hypothetical protein